MDQPNGELKQVPIITIAWEAEHQIVHLKFETTEFKTWEFVIAILDMAKEKANEQKKLGQMMLMQQAAQQQQQAAALAKGIKLGRG